MHRHRRTPTDGPLAPVRSRRIRPPARTLRGGADERRTTSEAARHALHQGLHGETGKEAAAHKRDEIAAAYAIEAPESVELFSLFPNVLLEARLGHLRKT